MSLLLTRLIDKQIFILFTPEKLSWNSWQLYPCSAVLKLLRYLQKVPFLFPWSSFKNEVRHTTENNKMCTYRKPNACFHLPCSKPWPQHFYWCQVLCSCQNTGNTVQPLKGQLIKGGKHKNRHNQQNVE